MGKRENQNKILKVLKKGPATPTYVRQHTGLNDQEFNKALGELLRNGEVTSNRGQLSAGDS